MAHRASVHLQTLDWDELFARTQAHYNRSMRERLVMPVLVCAALVPMIILVQGNAVGVVLITLEVSAVIVVVSWFRSPAPSSAPDQRQQGRRFFSSDRRSLERTALR